MPKIFHGKYKVGKITVSEAIIRPTGLLDPEIQIKPVSGQVEDVLEEVRQRVSRGQRVLITTLTKKFAEELDLYFKEINVKSAYIHSDVETLDRIEILADLRRGKYDVLIGINLLREGLDLPEVSLVAIFDADKEGFLRSRTSLIQIIGRAARHSEGKVIMYADSITGSMRQAIEETNRRRKLQQEYNFKNGIVPQTVVREMKTLVDDLEAEKKQDKNYGKSQITYTPNGFQALDSYIQLGSEKTNKTNSFKQKQNPNNRRGKQIFQDFEGVKEVFKNQILAKNYTQVELEKLLQQSVLDMNFEQAAAVRDILQESKPVFSPTGD